MDIGNIQANVAAANEALEVGDVQKARFQVALLRRLLDLEREAAEELNKIAPHLGRNLDMRV